MMREAPKKSEKLAWHDWGILALLGAYLVVLYGWWMRVVAGVSVVLLPWLLNQPGYRMYDTVIVQYPPLSLWLGQALQRIQPDPILRVRLGMIVVVGVSLTLIFWLARRWWGQSPAIIAAVLYALWAPVFMTYLMYFEVLVGLLVLLALTIWHRPTDSWLRPLCAGLLVGMAVLTKPQALLVVAVYFVWRLLAADREQLALHLGLFLSGTALPVLISVLIFASRGQLENFWFWTWQFNWGPFVTDKAHRLPVLTEWVIMGGWLLPAFPYAVHVFSNRQTWKREGLLLLGLLVALLGFAFPGYGRMRMSAAVPIVALISGAIWAVFPGLITRYGKIGRLVQGLFAVLVVFASLVALTLPTYYRIKLGPLVGEYDPLVPIVEQFAGETGAKPGMRVWMVTEVDPANNFYAIGGYLPPKIWVPVYSWFHAVPNMTDRVIGALNEEPPAYAVVIERQRALVPTALLDYLEGNYSLIGDMQAPDGYGTVIFYEYVP